MLQLKLSLPKIYYYSSLCIILLIINISSLQAKTYVPYNDNTTGGLNCADFTGNTGGLNTDDYSCCGDGFVDVANGEECDSGMYNAQPPATAFDTSNSAEPNKLSATCMATPLDPSCVDPDQQKLYGCNYDCTVNTDQNWECSYNASDTTEWKKIMDEMYLYLAAFSATEFNNKNCSECPGSAGSNRDPECDTYDRTLKYFFDMNNNGTKVSCGAVSDLTTTPAPPAIPTAQAAHITGFNTDGTPILALTNVTIINNSSIDDKVFLKRKNSAFCDSNGDVSVNGNIDRFTSRQTAPYNSNDPNTINNGCVICHDSSGNIVNNDPDCTSTGNTCKQYNFDILVENYGDC